MAFRFDDLLGGIGSAVSGFLGQKQADSSNRQQLAIAQANMNMQREFAQNGIKWKVDDAMRSGVHPLFALGANTTSFSPVSIGTTQADTSWAQNMGQHLGRAIQSTSTEGEREKQMSTSLALERGSLENELIRTQIARLKGQIGPPMPAMGGISRSGIDGQGNGPSPAAAIKVEPSEVTSSQPGAPGQEAGINPTYSYYNTGNGYQLMQAKNFKNASDDDIASQTAFNIDNRVIPPPPPPNVTLGPDEFWMWRAAYQKWQIYNRRDYGYGLARPHPSFNRNMNYGYPSP